MSLASKAWRVEDYLRTGAGSSTGGDSSASSRDFSKRAPLLVTGRRIGKLMSLPHIMLQ
jgi:hypothetical protein